MQIMTRGDTPTITISVDTAATLSNADDILLMIRQGDTLITRHKTDMTIDGDNLTITLTHDETLMLSDGTVRVQIQTDYGGTITASDIATATVGELLDDGGGLND